MLRAATRNTRTLASPKQVVAMFGLSDLFRKRLLNLSLPFAVDLVDLNHADSTSDARYGKESSLVLIGCAQLGAERALAMVSQLRACDSFVPIILVAQKSSEELTIAALRHRVTDYLRETDPTGEIVSCLERHANGRQPQPGCADVILIDGLRLVGESASIQELRKQVSRVAHSDCNVLISGETGTGKGLIAELIHANSGRHSREFASVNCAAIPDTLVESELFGHERGSFTGAHAFREGVLAQANKGTILMDEIGDLSLHAQAKLLHAMDNKVFRRVGGTELALDIRILAATNQDLGKMMKEGLFRHDLFYRLAITCIDIPPLRKRVDDIPILAEHFIRDLNRRTGHHVQGLTADLESLLRCFTWPGNVRELKNLIEACFVHMLPSSRPARLGLVDLPPDVRNRVCQRLTDNPKDDRDRILSALREADWNRTKAAKNLHWSRMTLYRKLSKYQLHELTRNTVSSS
jgi:DNA-binding NtrC family response regulator